MCFFSLQLPGGRADAAEARLQGFSPKTTQQFDIHRFLF